MFSPKSIREPDFAEQKRFPCGGLGPFAGRGKTQFGNPASSTVLSLSDQV